MNILSRGISIILSLGLLILVFELVRKRTLKEKYALLWLLTGAVIFILALSNTLLIKITEALGIMMPINTVFFCGIFFLVLINLHFSIVISNLTEQNKRLAQELALLKSRFSE